MNTVFTRIFLLLTIVTLPACTTMQAVQPGGQALADILETGDRIVVYEKSGRIVDMRYVRVDGRVLRGSMADDGLEVVEVVVTDIERIESERVAVGRTTAAVLGGVVALPIAALGAGLALSNY